MLNIHCTFKQGYLLNAVWSDYSRKSGFKAAHFLNVDLKEINGAIRASVMGLLVLCKYCSNEIAA